MNNIDENVKDIIEKALELNSNVKNEREEKNARRDLIKYSKYLISRNIGNVEEVSQNDFQESGIEKF